MTKAEYSLQIWSLLIGAARARRTHTYAEIERIVGMKRARRQWAPYLDPIQRYCQRKRFPDLTALVVNKATGAPGGMASDDLERWNRKRERVFGFPWFAQAPPEAKDFEGDAE